MLTARRRFLEFLLASPLLKAAPADSLADMLNVMDFEAVCKAKLPPAHFGYMATGVDDDVTLHANSAAYRKIHTLPRRLVDVSRLDTSVTLFGTKYETPIFLCPVSAQKAFHPQGEVAAARAANVKRTLLCLSTVATASVEEVTKANGKPIWQQLYPTSRWDYTERIVKRAEAAGCPVLVFTVDRVYGRNTETQERFKRLDSRQCGTCHPDGKLTYLRKPMFDGMDMTGVSSLNYTITWRDLAKLKSFSKMKLVIKGISTGEDAQRCFDSGADGVVVSNHGGRAEESNRSTIECLPDVVSAVGGKIPVLIDGGIRRGTDIFKALALGATAVGIGRPYVWGLGAFGQPGVERVLDILRLELEVAMRQNGAPRLVDINRRLVALPTAF